MIALGRHCIDCGTPLLPKEIDDGQVVCRTCRTADYLEAVAEEMELDRLGAAVAPLDPDQLADWYGDDSLALEDEHSESR